MTNLWTSGTKKAFYGFLAANIISALGSVLGLVPFLGMFLNLAEVAAYVVFILGLVAMKNAAVGTSVEAGTKRIFIGAIVLVVGAFVDILPVISMIAWIVTLAGFLLMWTGYGMLKNNAADANAQFAGNKLALSSLLGAIAALVGILPLVGGVLEFILLVVVLVFAYQGWKALANSELK